MHYRKAHRKCVKSQVASPKQPCGSSELDSIAHNLAWVTKGWAAIASPTRTCSVLSVQLASYFAPQATCFSALDRSSVIHVRSRCRSPGNRPFVQPLRNRNWSCCCGFGAQGGLPGRGEMAKDSLFGDLPPPVTAQPIPRTSAPGPGRAEAAPSVPSILSSFAASKRAGADDDSRAGKRVRFKPTTTEATGEQVVEAMAKIAAHIGNPGKFSKASKLALQLLQSGSVTPATADPFFSILKAAMTRPANAIDAALRRDYQTLFAEVHERLECFTAAQQAQIAVWEFWALVGNDFMTDDTYVFSKASGRVRQAIEELPEATEEEKMLEEREEKAKDEPVELEKAVDDVEENDPFGLSVFLPKRSKKEERLKKKLEEEAAAKRAHEEAARLLRERREALFQCLKLAADQYRHTWAQTIIDILVRHAFDNRVKFTTLHQTAIEKLWASVRDQQIRRKQGKSTTGKLDVTSFERYQEQYSRETISIRRGVGQGGGRSAETWLG